MHERGRRRRYLLGVGLSLIALLVLGLSTAAWSAAPAPSSSKQSSPLRLISRGPHGSWAATESPKSGAASTNGVIVEFVPGASVAGALRGLNAEETATRNLHALSGSSSSVAVVKSKTLSDRQLADKLRGVPGVARVSPNNVDTALSSPNDPFYTSGQLWGLSHTAAWPYGGTIGADIDAPEAWDITTGSPDVVVAVIDSGVAYTHRDLAGNMWVNPGEIPKDGIDNDDNGYVDDVYGIDAYSGDTDPWDENGHGTHVAGTIAAMGNNGLGVTGVAWQAKIMALRFLGPSGTGDDAGAVECINYAIDMKLHHGVDIVAINASWGAYGAPDESLSRAIQAAGEAGIVFCAAAGNDAINNDVTPNYPASYTCNNILSVGASDFYDNPASFGSGRGSNYGATSVDVFAPGLQIYSTVPRYPYYYPAAGDPFFDDMESGPEKWIPDGTWAITTEAHASGTHSWSDSPGGDYLPRTDSSLTSQPLDLRSLAGHDAVLGFYAVFTLENRYDYLWVEASGDGGADWITLGKLTGTEAGGYYNVSLPSQVLTDQCQVRFRLVSDEIYEYDGAHLDDVGIAAVSPDECAAMSGTSMAAPFVTGTVALLAAADPAESVAQRISRVLSAADAMPALKGLCLSGGRLNAAVAVSEAAPIPTRYDEKNDPHFLYSGAWTSFSRVDAYGGSYMRSNTAGSSVTIYFSGTRLDWIAMKGLTTGKADVYLDGVFDQTVDLSNPSGAMYQQKVWTTRILDDRVHYVTIALNAASASAGKYVTIDAVDVVGTLFYPVPTIVAVTPDSGSYSGGTSVTINGTGFTGVTAVTFDGIPAIGYTVDSSTQITAVTPPHASGTVPVRVTAAGGTSVDSSYGEYTYTEVPPPPPLSEFQQSRTEILYSPAASWSTFNTKSASGGSYARSSASGASVVIPFVGTGLDWIATVGTTLGKADVYVDNVFETTVDLHRSSVSYQQDVWSTGTLDSGYHTVKIVRSASSPTGKYVDLDRVDVAGSLVASARAEQGDPHLAWSGVWSDFYTASASAGSYRRSSTAGAAVTIEFEGVRLDWIATRGTTLGKADVYLDDVFQGTIDLYRSRVAYRQNVWSTGFLTAGLHTVKLVRNAGSAVGKYISVDAVDVWGELR